MSTEISKPTTAIVVEVEEKRADVILKMQKFAVMGRVVHDSNLKFQARGQAIAKKLIMNPGELLVTDAESKLKEAGKDLEELSEDILQITRKFDALNDQLRASKNFVKEQIDLAKKDLLVVKQEISKEEADAKLKSDELRRIREAILNKIGDMEAGYKQKIATTTHLAFESALKGGITEEMLPAWLADVKQRGVMNGDVSEIFTWPRPGIKPVHNTVDAVNAIWAELESKIMKPEWYRTLLDAELDKRFEFYGIAVKHKAETLAQSEKELAATVAEIADEKENAVVANKMESIATTYNVVAGNNGKQLKGVWEVEMPDTEEAALKIMSAFIGNIAACRGGVRASWSKLSVTQMATALAWTKNKDRNFTVTGINFVERDKL